MTKVTLGFSICIFLISGLFINNLFSQDKFSDEIKTRMWGSAETIFEETEVPEKWQDESAVILARSVHVIYKKPVMQERVQEEYYVHFRIKLLDKAAVNDYSELEISTIKAYGYNTGTFYGIKIIKPDGTEKEVDLEENAVEADDERSVKVAIPDINEGDIIDYYIVHISAHFVDMKWGFYSYTFSTFDLPLTMEYPVLKQRFTVDMNRKTYFNVQLLNGAPNFKEQGSEKELLYVLEDSDREGAPTDNWFLSNRSIPTIRFKARIGDVSLKNKNLLGVHDILKTEVSSKELKDFIKKDAENINPSLSGTSLYLASITYKHLKKNKISPDNMDQFLEEAYNYLRHVQGVRYREKAILEKSYYNYYRNDLYYNKILTYIFTKFKVDYEVLATVSRAKCNIDDNILPDDILYFLKVKNKNKDVILANVHDINTVGKVYTTIEGQKGYYVNPTTKFKDRKVKEFVVPVSTASENTKAETLDVNLNENMDQLLVKRQVSAGGHQKTNYVYKATTVYDLIYSDYEWLKDKKGGFDIEEKDKRPDPKKVDKITIRKDEDNKKRLDKMEELTKNEFDTEIKEYKSFELIQPGNRSDKSEIKFKDEFIIEDFIKQIGPNYLIEICKMIGGQVEINKDERTRDLDIYMNYARTFDYTINFSVPEGYEVEGLDKLNYNIANETGGFISSAELKDGKIIIKAKKYYSHNYEKAENWPSMLEFLDAAYDFTQQKVLLKKKM